MKKTFEIRKKLLVSFESGAEIRPELTDQIIGGGNAAPHRPHAEHKARGDGRPPEQTALYTCACWTLPLAACISLFDCPQN